MFQLLDSYIEYLQQSLIGYIIEGLDCTAGYIAIIKEQLEQTIKKPETKQKEEII